MSNFKSAVIRLPYFKQGDDFANNLVDAESPAEACRLHATQLSAAAVQLRTIADIIQNNHDVIVEGCTHTILVDGPSEVVDILIDKGLAILDCDNEPVEDELVDEYDFSRDVWINRDLSDDDLEEFEELM